MITDAEVGAVLRFWRQHRRVSQSELTRQVPGWCSSTLSKVEAGKRSLKAQELAIISRALDIRVEKFLDISVITGDVALRIEKLSNEIDRLKAMMSQ